MAKISVLTKDFDDSLLNRTDPIVYLPKVAAPFTTVVKRALMTDLANDLLPRFGIDRVMTQTTQEVQGESGPAGERVFNPINDQHDAVRFVGLISDGTDSLGQRVNIQASSYVEYTFYGTGLNLLLYTDGSNRDMSVSVDSGGSTTVANTGSTVLNGRNYSQNGVINVASGLTLGLHTVKVSRNTANILVYGYEVLNTNSTLQLLPGRSYLGGKRLYKAAASTDAYNSNFESGTLGTKGGHVVVYQKSDGTVAKAVRPTNASQANLTSADHTNEEVIRTYRWREFGAGRTDDFSTLLGPGNARSAAFTLDDGTTSLVLSNGNSFQAGSDREAVTITSSTNFLTFTFVGTGLDVTQERTNAATGVYSIFVDGASIASSVVGSTLFSTVPKIIKIVSGLPYGTHTVKIVVDTAGTDCVFGNFIVYGPAKPAIPSGAIELADYYLLGNYSTGGAGLDTIANGVIRKQNVREFVYGGTYLVIGSSPGVLEASGYEVQTQVVSSFAEYIFFGTGFEYRNRANTVYSATNTVSLQFLSGGGSLLTLNSTNFPGLTAASLSGSTFTYASGNLAQNTSNQLGSGFSITGLTLGTYRLRITAGTTAGMLTDSLDIITPVHSPKNNQPGDLQNALPIGSCAIGDSRKFSSTAVKTLANWVQAIGVVNNPSTTSTIFVPCPDLSVTIKTNGNPINISYYMSSLWAPIGSAPPTGETTIYVDGVKRSQGCLTGNTATLIYENLSENVMVAVSAGTHKVDVYWKTLNAANTLYCQNEYRCLTVSEK